MQNAGDNDARGYLYQGLAADAWGMGEGWTNQHQLDAGLASSLEGAAGGPNAGVFDLPYRTYHTNLAVPDLVTQHPAASGGAGHHLLWCPYPRCFGGFYSQQLLDEHFKIHTNHAESMGLFGVHANRQGMVAVGGVHVNHQEAMYVNNIGYNNPISGLPATQYQNPGFSTPGAYSHFAQTPLVGNLDYTVTATPASPPRPAPQANQTSYATVGAVGEGAPRQPIPPSSSASASSPGGRHLCLECNKTFSRNGELKRHALKHKPGPRRWECETPGCHRKGLEGFDRKDKMRDHSKVCRARANRA
ncbi:MAG: hypothetical protein Q9207_005551 [Kuettlingeria erythrocarpa]